MATLVGVCALGTGASGEADRVFVALTASLGEPLVSASEGRVRAAIFAQYAGEEVFTPGVAGPAASALPMGIGGDGTVRAPASLVPPWLVCRWDAVRDEAVVSIDRYGFALLYVRTVGGVVAFSTSASALGRLAPSLDRDDAAVAELMAFDHLLGCRTLRSGVRAVPQGHDLVIDPGGASFRAMFRYGDLHLAPPRVPGTASALVRSWREAMTMTLASRGASPVLIPLSGGLDSRLLAASAIEAGASIACFTFGRPASPDVAIAARVTRELGVPWSVHELEDDWLAAYAEPAAALTDGQLDLIHSYGVSVFDRLPAGRLRLDGLAGDVVLGGSFLQMVGGQTIGRAKQVEALFKARSRLANPGFQALLTPAARGAMTALARRSLEESLEGTCDEGDPRWSDFWILRHRIRRFTVNGPLLWQACARSVFPFFEPRFLDRLLAVPPEERAKAKLQAAFLREGWPAMADIPWQKTGYPVPRSGLVGRVRDRVTRLRKPAFRPGASFFDHDAAVHASPRLRGFLRDRLLDATSGVARFGCFERGEVEKTLRELEQGGRGGMAKLGPLLTLVMGEAVWSG